MKPIPDTDTTADHSGGRGTSHSTAKNSAVSDVPEITSSFGPPRTRSIEPNTNAPSDIASAIARTAFPSATGSSLCTSAK